MNNQDYYTATSSTAPAQQSGPHPVQQSHHDPLKHSNAGPVLGIVVLLLLIGGGAFAAYKAQVFPFGKGVDPYTVLDRSLMAMQNVSSQQTTIDVKVEIDLSEVKKRSAERSAYLTAQRAANQNQIDSLSSDINFLDEPSLFELMPSARDPFEDFPEHIKVQIDMESVGNGQYGIDREFRNEISIDSPFAALAFENRIIGDKFYFQIEDITLAATTPIDSVFPSIFLQPIIDSITGTWIAFDRKVDTLPFGADVDDGGPKKSDEERARELLDAFFNLQPLRLTDLGGERGMYVFDVDVDVDALEQFLKEAAAIQGEPAILSETKVARQVKQLREMQEAAEDLSIQLRIDKSTYLISSIDVVGTIALPGTDEYYDLASEESVVGESATMKIDGRMVFSKYNEKISVEEPTSAKSISDLVSDIFGINMEESRSNAKASQVLSHIKQIQTALELYYLDNNAYPITEVPLVLGQADTACLNANGFEPVGCDTPIMGLVPIHPNSDYAYAYRSMDGIQYEIVTVLDSAVAGLKEGILRATPSGLDTVLSHDLAGVAGYVPAQDTRGGDKVDADADGIPDDIELIIGTDPNNFDTDGDGFADGMEVEAGYNPLGPGKIDEI